MAARTPSRLHFIARLAALAMLLASSPLSARKFYSDDPLKAEPPPRSVGSALSRKLSEYYDFFHHTFFHPGEQATVSNPIPALGVNTLGEVPDSGWYTNRHYQNRMTIEELAR